MTLRKYEESELKEKALYHTLWRTCFGRGYGFLVRYITC